MIKGKYIGLRSIDEKDLSQLLAWRNQEDYRQYFREYRELNKTQQSQWLESISQQNSNSLMFSIVGLDTNELLGACGFCYLNLINKNADFSLYIGKDNLYIDDKYAVDTSRTLLKYGFNELGLHRVWAEIYDFDRKKNKLFKQLGFSIDGTHRDTYWHNGKWHNSLFFSMLSTDNKTK
jgi:RimJ/RimL family protein N-acetyltransferase